MMVESTEIDPRHDEDPDASDSELTELATGFALGELNEDELHRLHDALRSPEHGERAARITWQTLGTTVDLRASLGTQLQDATRLRVDAADEPERDRSFLGGVFNRMGIERPTLRPIRIPLLEGLRRRSLLPWTIVLSGALLLGLLVWSLSSSAGLAEVAGIRGAATVEGRYLRVGDGLDRRPILLARDAVLRLHWQDDGEARLIVKGPARLVPQQGGVSLISGRAWLHCQQPFTLGLPDAQARIEAGSDVAVEAIGERSLLAVANGAAELQGPLGRAQRLEAGESTVAGSEPFSWTRSVDWVGATENGERRLQAPIDAPAWRLALTISFSDIADRLVLSAATGTSIEFRPGSVRIEDPSGERVQKLAGAPMRDRRVLLESLPERGESLSVEGLNDPLAVDLNRVPDRFVFVGHAAASELSFHTGPTPLPDELRD